MLKSAAMPATLAALAAATAKLLKLNRAPLMRKGSLNLLLGAVGAWRRFAAVSWRSARW